MSFLIDFDNLINLPYDEFKSKYLNFKSPTVIDDQIHLKLAKRFDNNGEIEKALNEYNLAVRDDCQLPEVYEKIAEYNYDLGNIKNSIRFYEKLIEIKPEFNIAIRLATVYEELDMLDKSNKLYLKLYEKTKDDRYKAQLKNIENQYFKKKTEKKEHFDIGDSILLKFVDLFSGREGVYARQWINERNEIGYSPIRQHFSPKIAKNHLLGNNTIGIYQMRINSTVCWAAFDIDLTKKYYKQMEQGEFNRELMLTLTFEVAEKIYNTLKKLDIISYIEFSGFKGYHIWIFFKRPIPAFQVRIFLKLILATIEFDNKKISVEVFPKQTKVNKGGLGNLIKLPLGVHKKSDSFSFFVDINAKKIPLQFELLHSIEKVNKDLFQKQLSKLRKNISLKKEKPENKEKEITIDIEEIERDKESFDPFTIAEFNYILSKCEVIAYLVNKLIKTKKLNNDEKIILKYTFGHLNDGAEIVNYLLTLAPDYKEVDLLKTKFSGNPVSCPKIRKRLREITQYLDCNCDFGDTNTYPNPLLHLKDFYKNDSGPLRKQEAEAIKFQNILSQYLKLKNEINERQRNILEMESYFHKYFDKKKVEEIKTSYGIIQRVYHPTGESEFIIKL